VTVFGRDAETLADVIQEGQKQRVAVSGRASTREYEVDGQTRTSLDVVADIVGIIPSARKAQQDAGANTWQSPANAPASNTWGQSDNGQPPF
jgi:single-stranded DNA-binding protein